MPGSGHSGYNGKKSKPKARSTKSSPGPKAAKPLGSGEATGSMFFLINQDAELFPEEDERVASH